MASKLIYLVKNKTLKNPDSMLLRKHNTFQ